MLIGHDENTADNIFKIKMKVTLSGLDGKVWVRARATVMS